MSGCVTTSSCPGAEDAKSLRGVITGSSSWPAKKMPFFSKCRCTVRDDSTTERSVAPQEGKADATSAKSSSSPDDDPSSSARSILTAELHSAVEFLFGSPAGDLAERTERTTSESAQLVLPARSTCDSNTSPWSSSERVRKSPRTSASSSHSSSLSPVPLTSIIKRTSASHQPMAERLRAPPISPMLIVSRKTIPDPLGFLAIVYAPCMLCHVPTRRFS
mmetsp:Transcript_105074/g.234527  ORF Transcript_105074/g.234527 Transcript_105074/m.234527 type:complete len:219 (-) Transcript_105074:1536-2192(-)